jgi:hypothetical protein
MTLDLTPQSNVDSTSHTKLHTQLAPSQSLLSLTHSSSFYSPLSQTVGLPGFLPLSCFQQMIAMKMDVQQGSPMIDGQNVQLDGSEFAYVEKTWGRTFPSEYVWMHSTRFTNDQASPLIDSLFFSVADVPLFASVSSPGFVSTLLFNKSYIHFASHLGSIIDVEYPDQLNLIIRLYDQSFDHELTIELERQRLVEYHKDAWLYAAKDGKMRKAIKQQIGKDKCTVTLNRLIRQSKQSHLPGNGDQFAVHGYSRVLLSQAHSQAVALEVMMGRDGRLTSLIHRLHDSMRPWTTGWIQINTPLISISLPFAAWWIALEMLQESVNDAPWLPVFVACTMIMLISLLVSKYKS